MERYSTESERTGETRAADALTVAWMLTVFAGFAAELIAVLGWSIMLAGGGPEKFSHEIALMPRVALFISIVLGLVCLILIPAVYRLRRVPPPTAVTVAAALVGLFPWGMMLVLSRF